MTGFQPEKIFLRNEKTGIFPHSMINKYYGGEKGFWKFMMERRRDNCLMGCSIIGGDKKGQMIIDGQPSGLIYNHAYGINDVFELKCLKMETHF
jgi:hypothetical protein